jgi:hypothetical protein
LYYISPEDDFYSAYIKIKVHFNTDVNYYYYYTNWTTITFSKIKQENPDQTLYQALDHLLDKLQLCQRALGPAYAGEDAFQTIVIRACRNSPELEIALYKPARVCEELFADLRSAIEVVLNRSSGPKFYAFENATRMNYVNRIYTSNKPLQQQPKARFGRAGCSNYQDRTSNDKWKKKCFVCQKEGCWLIKHPPEERKRSQTQYISQCHIQGTDFGSYATFLAGFEGVKLFSNDPESENSYEELDDYDTIASVSYLMD